VVEADLTGYYALQNRKDRIKAGKPYVRNVKNGIGFDDLGTPLTRICGEPVALKAISCGAQDTAAVRCLIDLTQSTLEK
jgi:hypothetical protein